MEGSPVESEGGGTPYFFAGHAAFVHTAQGIRPGVMELPEGWNLPDFKWPRGRQVLYRVDVGARDADEVEALGLKVGDFITIPKRYRPLLGRRAIGRSFDDRVGDAALLSAAWALGPNLKNRNVTFICSRKRNWGWRAQRQRPSAWPPKGKHRILSLPSILSSAPTRRWNRSALRMPGSAKAL